jgi:hypothetical protein
MFSKDTYFVGSKFPKFAKKGSIAVNTTTGTINYLEPDGDWISVSASGGNANTGDITFDGVKVIGAGTASGDGADLGTIELVPDGSLTSDQYLIIDPTAPNHIHIRAGGEQDASTADLIIGAENTNVLVSDTGDYVDIRTTSDSNSYIYRFDSSGYLSGPAMGGLFVSGLLNGENDLWLGSNTNVVLSPGSESSAFVGDTSNPNNQIATIGDLANLVDSAPATLNTLNELAAALGDNPNFATSVSTSLGNKARVREPDFVATDYIEGSGTFQITVYATTFYSNTSNSFAMEGMGITFPTVSGGPYYAPNSSTITMLYPEELSGAEFSLTREDDPYGAQSFFGSFTLLSSSYQSVLDDISANPSNYYEHWTWTGPAYGEQPTEVYVQPTDIARIAGLTSNVQAQIDAIKAHLGMS